MARARIFAALHGLPLGRMPAEVLAALTLAAIALPEQMATARLMGLPPAAGLIAFLAGTLAFAAFGTHRSLSVGADSTIAPIMAAGLAGIAAIGSPAYAGAAAALAVLTGLVLVLAHPLRLGWIADLLSIPVTTGFMAGIAVHVIVGALPPILGVAGVAGSVPEQVAALTAALSAVDPAALALGLGVAAVALAFEAWRPRLPGALIALTASAGAAAVLAHAGHPVEMMGTLRIVALPEGARGLLAPLADWQTLSSLLPLALIVALVVMMQTAAVLQSTPKGQIPPADPDRDFAAVGAGSVLAGLLGSFAVNASPPRTAVAEAAGARSQWSALIAVALALGVAALAAGTFAHVPRAGLNGVLLVIGLRLMRPALVVRIRHRSPVELPLILAAAALVIFLPIVAGVGLAVVLSLLHAIYTIARPRCAELARVPGTTIWWTRPPGARAEREPGVLVFALGAPVNFMNARYLLGRVEAAVARSHPRLLVIEASAVIAIDYTGSELLQQAIARLRGRGVEVALARLESAAAAEAAERSGLTAAIGRARVFLSVEDAVRALRPIPEGTRPHG